MSSALRRRIYMARTITFQGKPLSLAGNAPNVGSPAPLFTVTSQDMKNVTLSDFKGKIKLISTFPSLDTPVCDLQVKEFNKRSAGMSADVAVIGISKDLPFAQKRFCSENGIKNETVLSDYKASSFGLAYGMLIDGLMLLARSVIIIDKDDVLRYVQIVPELTKPPDYDAALKALEDLIRKTAVKK
jgi:thiol peroxidase